jgi:multidrug efflux pump subunit AcrA (membrane-fusion protein)
VKIKEKFLTGFKKLLGSRKVAALVFTGLILLAVLGWKLAGGKDKEQEKLLTAQVERGMIVSTVSASGQVLSVNIMSANTQASGIVQQVYVKDGDQVQKGDKIMEIDLDFQGEQKNAQAWSSYLSAKNNLESAKASLYSLQADMFGRWDSFNKLAESDDYQDVNSDNRNLPEFHIAEKEWLAAEAKYKNQQAVISQVQAAINSSWLSYIQTSPTITAPTDGVITSLMYAEGMSIGFLDTGSSTTNEKVATIKTEGMPIVLVNLSEIDVSQVELGQKATVVLDSISDKTFAGEVIGVDRIGQSTSGVTQYPAIIKLDSSSDLILPNMTVTGNIVISRKDNVLLVPSTAIQSQGGQSFVTVVDNGVQESVAVETGLVSDRQTEIVSGLDEGEIIISSIFSLSSDQEDSPFGTSGMRIMGGPR